MADQWRNTGAALTRLLERATPDSIQAEDVAIVRAELDQLRQRLEVCDYDAGKKTQTITELKGFIDTLRSRLAEYEGIGAKLALAERAIRGPLGYEEAIRRMMGIIEKQTGLLRIAACPNEGCVDGGYYQNGEPTQCQWCHERAAIDASGEGHD